MLQRRNFINRTVASLASLGLLSSKEVKSKPLAKTNPSMAGELSKKPRMMFYHDGRHPLIYMYEPPMQKEEYESAVDELLETPIEALMFTMGDGRTVLHDTQVGELWGHYLKRWSHMIFNRAYKNAKGLIESGNDPLRVVCERARKKGLAIYPVLLVQQGTGKRGEDTRASEFRLNNRHLEIGSSGGVDSSFPGFHGLDFKYEEVRDERFALIEETVNRYPVDGFELQLNYMPYYFRPDEIETGRSIMTEWIARVYQAVKKSGQQRELAIRIPASIEGCYSVGLDIQEWINRGIVDVLIGQNFAGPELLDQMADFRPLVAAAKGSNCRVHAAIHSHIDSDRLSEGTIKMMRAAACNYWEQGIDGLYFAQWFSNWPYEGSFYEKLREAPYPEVMAPKDKTYFIPTITNRYSKPRLEPGLSMQLPVDLKVNQAVHLEMSINDELHRWQKAGRVKEVLLRVRITNSTELDQLNFRLNGKTLSESLLRKINQLYRMTAPRYRINNSYWFIYRLDRSNWPKKGKNILAITLTRRDPSVIPQIFVRDVELDIKYLLGKNFHRGQDPDLGEVESLSG